MEKLIDVYHQTLGNIATHFIRYLHEKIIWKNNLNLILGCRGVGKTTLMLQHIILSHEENQSLYVSADHPYFTATSLLDLATNFYNHGGKNLYIDEVHKYPGWSRDIKAIHDTYPALKLVLSGSSMIDIIKGVEVDLSRRALVYRLEPMSLREYINFSQGLNIQPFTLDEILLGKAKTIPGLEHPLQLFDEYLQRGCYPFMYEYEYRQRLDTVVSQTLEVDIPNQVNITLPTARKLKKLMYVVAQSTPFKPNYSNLGRTLEMDRSMVAEMMSYLERAGLLRLLREADNIMDSFTKVEKIYLNNTNLCFSLYDSVPDKGNLRETFFFSQTSVQHQVSASPISDFIVDGHTFEVGGKNKKRKQVAEIKDAFVVKDDILYPHLHIIPLWMFGLLY
ncbi:MAG: ATP-binding protein [Bacteroidales bacterium]|nr:ATP-binding protein [Bacteroidales bacterium]